MKKFIVSVSEDISHSYEVEAEDKESALEAYYKLTDDELKSKDLDGNHSWDTPWDVSESEGV
jgi:hypothetical protein